MDLTLIICFLSPICRFLEPIRSFIYGQQQSLLLERGTLSRDQHDGDVVGGAEVGAGDGSVGLCKHVQACCFPVSVRLRAGKTQAEGPS